jgi:hypothetical protein
MYEPIRGHDMRSNKSNIAHVLVPPNYVAALTGCRQISKHNNTVTAHYTDGTEDSVEWPEYDILANKDNFYSVLGDIQARVKETQIMVDDD